MATPPPERDRDLKRTGRRLLLIGAVMAAIGLALTIPLDGTPSGIGVAIASLGSVPLLAGIALIVSAAVSQRSRAGKPFA